MRPPDFNPPHSLLTVAAMAQFADRVLGELLSDSPRVAWAHREFRLPVAAAVPWDMPPAFTFEGQSYGPRWRIVDRFDGFVLGYTNQEQAAILADFSRVWFQRADAMYPGLQQLCRRLAVRFENRARPYNI